MALHAKDGNAETNVGLMTVMRKTSLLAIISSMNMLFSAIMNLILTKSESEHIMFLFSLSILADFATSFACILLSFNYFKIYYQALCGCFEKCCFRDHADMQMDKDADGTINNEENLGIVMTQKDSESAIIIPFTPLSPETGDSE